jgi:hypothetical protein
MLVEHIGLPLILKTDQDNAASNQFYLALGFQRAGLIVKSSGREMVEYIKEAQL